MDSAENTDPVYRSPCHDQVDVSASGVVIEKVLSTSFTCSGFVDIARIGGRGGKRESDAVMNRLFGDPEFREMLRKKLTELKL